MTTFVKNNVPNTTASKIEIDFPKTVKISGKGLTKCAVSEFSKPGGKANCPPKSQAGTGSPTPSWARSALRSSST